MLRASIQFDLTSWRGVEWFLRERFANFSLKWLKLGRQHRLVGSARYSRTFANKIAAAQICNEGLEDIFRLIA